MDEYNTLRVETSGAVMNVIISNPPINLQDDAMMEDLSCPRRILSRRSHIIGFQPLTTGTAAHESARERGSVTITTFDSHRKTKRRNHAQ